MYAVELNRITHRYDGIAVLQDLDLQLGEGEVLGLFGHNGAGKTTSIKLILGLLQPTAGQVRVLGQVPSQASVRQQLGYLPENVMFYPQLSGRETLRHFARLKKASPQQVEQLLQQVGLAAAAKQRVKTYSKGMRQRLGLAQALLGKPRLLLLDEPTVGLDPVATSELYELVDTLRHQGTSVILCSHALPGVESHIDRAAILSHGHLQALGSLKALRTQAALPIVIHFEGLDRRDHWQAVYADQGYKVCLLGDQGFEIALESDKKQEVLRQMLNEASFVDLEIRQPGLEDLYRYFVAQSQMSELPQVVTENKAVAQVSSV